MTPLLWPVIYKFFTFVNPLRCAEFIRLTALSFESTEKSDGKFLAGTSSYMVKKIISVKLFRIILKKETLQKILLKMGQEETHDIEVYRNRLMHLCL